MTWAGDSALKPSLERLEQALGRLAGKRARYLELYAAGVISDADELAKCLAQVAAEQAFLEEPMAAARAVSGAHTRRSGRDDFESLCARFEAAWPGKPEGLWEAPKHALLRELRAEITVRVEPQVSPHPAPAASKGRRQSGRMSLMLALPAFGLLGDRALRLAESDEALARYWAWRGAFFRGPGGLLATFKAGAARENTLKETRPAGQSQPSGTSDTGTSDTGNFEYAGDFENTGDDESW